MFCSLPAIVNWKTIVVAVVVAVKWQQLAYHSQCLPSLIVCNRVTWSHACDNFPPKHWRARLSRQKRVRLGRQLTFGSPVIKCTTKGKVCHSTLGKLKSDKNILLPRVLWIKMLSPVSSDFENQCTPIKTPPPPVLQRNKRSVP